MFLYTNEQIRNNSDVCKFITLLKAYTYFTKNV